MEKCLKEEVRMEIIKDGINLNIKLEDHSENEINEITVIFGQVIYIIENSSYKSFHTRREESTFVMTTKKVRDVNPVLLCDDVYLALKELKKDKISLIDIYDIISEFNIVV